ncbi:hypothetical protein MAIT1_05389 [Magnetofaba australis IT-1]|uniref:Uncharacterized protein n=2 Tax=Magnetofaba TaxID=1472292 RepID=A0A1Y2K5N1_9PROT|nr:hypothetical protein MAIT1_05389 [Magnetofaba australis IT-1]
MPNQRRKQFPLLGALSLCAAFILSPPTPSQAQSRQEMMEAWRNMTPEQRQAYRQQRMTLGQGQTGQQGMGQGQMGQQGQMPPPPPQNGMNQGQMGRMGQQGQMPPRLRVAWARGNPGSKAWGSKAWPLSIAVAKAKWDNRARCLRRRRRTA